MKRILATVLGIAMVMSLVGCTGQPEQPASSVVTSPTTATTTEPPLTVTFPDLKPYTESSSTVIYTQNAEGHWDEMLTLPGGNKRGKLTSFSAASQNAFIAAFDPAFYNHNGADGEALTITQRLLQLSNSADAEMLRRGAVEMEASHASKSEILEAFLNTVTFCDGVVGVREAAYYYYGIEAKELTAAQSALLAAVALDPAKNDPFSAPEAAKAARTTVLDAMLERKLINAEQYAAASAEALPASSHKEEVPVWDYYVDLLIEDVIDDLMAAKGYSYEEAEEEVLRGGLKIYSYENVEKQKAVESVFLNFGFPGSSVNSTIFIMDYEGRVVATVGGRGEKTENRILNRATDVRRQPGSTIKPIAVYAPALEEDIINYSTVVRDAPILLDAYTLWPPNYQQQPMDMGWTTVKYALQQSHNTVPVRILMQLGTRESYNFLRDTLHVTSPQEIDVNLGALALGGFAEGVTAREMAAAYQVFGNSGVYNKPHTYYSVEKNGEVLLKHTLEQEQAISPETATVMNKLLQNVVREGTGSAISHHWPDMTVFAKTGTTDAYRDSYFVGGTPYYVAALWMGYDSFASMTPDQCSYQKQLWSQCMLALHGDKPAADFPLWGNVEGHYYDPYSGIVNDSYGNYGWYKAGHVPYEYNTIEATIYTPQTTATTPKPTTTTAVKPTTTAPTTAAPTAAPTTAPTEPPTTVPTEPPTTVPTEPPTTVPTEPPTTEPPVTTTTAADVPLE